MFQLNYPTFWQKKGLAAYLLWPLSLIFYFIGKIRSIFIKQIKLETKVICVGNISIGGTGKTQLVILLAKFFDQKQVKFIIISKGYNSNLKNKAMLVNNDHSVEQVGDESLILRKYGTVIATKKIKYALDLINSLRPSLIIMDDGMQNRSLYKDCTILTIDSYRNFGNEYMIPAGPLRSPIYEGLNAADVIINIGDNKINLNTKNLIFNAKIIQDPAFLVDKNKNYFAFCGIGNPKKFFKTLTENKIKLLGFKSFPDHHNYSSSDIKYLRSKINNTDAMLITTEKDYVKISNKLTTVCLKTSLSIENQEKFLAFIYEKFSATI